MAKEQNNLNDKLALMNDAVFSHVYTAGTNVKKFTQQAEKRNQPMNVKEASEFVLRVVESRRQPLDVNARLVCGMGRILLHYLQNILGEVLSVQQRSTIDRRIVYKQKNVVRNVKMQLARKAGGGSNATAAPIDMDVEELNFDLDMQEKITEKEVIFTLTSCNNATTVKNVDDITMRDEMFQNSCATQLQLTDDDGFGETMSTEMLHVFFANNEAVEDSIAPIRSEPASLQGLVNIDLSVNADVDMENDSNYTTQKILPLEDIIPPLPMENSIHDMNDQLLHSFGDNGSSIASLHKDDDVASINSVKVDTQIVKCRTGLKRRLIIDVCTQISTKSFNKMVLNWPTIFAKRQAPSIQMILAEQRLQNLFTKPVRDCCNRSKFDPILLPTRKPTNHFFDGDEDFCRQKSHHTKQLTANGERTEQTVDILQDAIDLPPVETSDNPHVDSLVPRKASGMKDFLASFTGNQSDWDYLKSCEPSSSEEDKQKNKEEGAVTMYALKTLLGALFAEVSDNSISVEMLVSKIGNKMIAISIFSKLLELSKQKIIRLYGDKNGYFSYVEKFNWE